MRWEEGELDEANCWRAAAPSGLIPDRGEATPGGRPADRKARSTLFAVSIAPAIQHAPPDLKLVMQRTHAFAVHHPLRYTLFELQTEDPVLPSGCGLLSVY